MEELLQVLRRVGVWLVALAIGAVGLLVLCHVLLPPIARVATAFIATPGGLVLIILWWRWTRKRNGS